MFRRHLFCIALMSSMTSVSAQTTLFQANAPTTKTPPPTAAPKVLTPSEFTSKVQSMDQEVQKQVMKQMEQKLTKKPLPPLPQAPQTMSPSQQPSKPEEDKNTSLKKPQRNEPAAIPQMPADADTAEPQSAVITPPAAAPVQSQPYTGFGASGEAVPAQGGSSGAGSQSSGSGWNIKY